MRKSIKPDHYHGTIWKTTLGEIGREFIATLYTPDGTEFGRILEVGEVLPARKHDDQTTMQVVSLEGKSFQGSQWYKFRVVPAPEAIAAGCKKPVKAVRA